jgi:hypothetical protein
MTTSGPLTLYASFMHVLPPKGSERKIKIGVLNSPLTDDVVAQSAR